MINTPASHFGDPRLNLGLKIDYPDRFFMVFILYAIHFNEI
jgi:hypothetical protein